MALVTLTVLEGLERGRIFRNLQTPVTIGREEVNSVQLNDERISRLHAKLQEDHGNILFTDLHSTNGSRINGHPVQIRVLQPGDQLQLGRCSLLYGSAAEIQARALKLGIPLHPWQRPVTDDPHAVPEPLPVHEQAGHLRETDQGMLPLFCGERPPLPEQLGPLQRARLSDLLMYVHEILQLILQEAQELEPDRARVEFSWQRFQNLLLLQRDLAVWLGQASGSVGDESEWP
ncbi:MAG: FHA domain-containing protein [Planctomycetota bacterium]